MLLEDPEMGGLAVVMVLEWGYLDVWMVLKWVMCLCVWGRYGICYGSMFCLVLVSCSCKV